MKCPYCGSPVLLADSIEVYKVRSYGKIWLCSNYPECDAYVGCHQGTDEPLGTPANEALRRARNAAHAAFDPLWQCGGMSRSEAYRRLSVAMGIPKEKCHIAMFDEEQCREAVELLRPRSSYACKTCGCDKPEIRSSGPHIGRFCSKCGAWDKWLNRVEKAAEGF